ncbi:polysaccharide deacetylase family protein [Streptococcus suis]|uniref:Polysaccharide deacetylase family protein n=1 Tax=Streptococcus suis TaxID=1307 RepID=A0A4T2GPG4_STRSU|nr:polysaccharide deacetylase family protein [Streptococcus suis]MBM7269069.1 polysaccharide deacetylase family protein [Streptococcus suis]TII01106.1 polysaccharide deacetylase family protein [Streptococcus suis]
MTAPHTRSSRRRRRKSSPKLGLWFSMLLSLLFILGTMILFIKGISLFRQDSQASTPISSFLTSSTTSESQASTSQDDSTNSSDIPWEQQAEPVKVPILMYHAIHVMSPEESANANLIVDPTTFETHLQALQEAGYYSLSPEEAYKVLTENVLPAGKKVVWLTFDDSLWDFYDIAYPILKKNKMKATNNVITGRTESGMAGHLTLDQLKEMQANGMSFQGHTVTHPDLEYSSLEDQTRELQLSKTYLDTNLNQDTLAVAYPAGRYSTDTLSIAESIGYKLGVTTNEGLASAADGLLSLNRVRILPTTTPETLLQTIAQ